MKTITVTDEMYKFLVETGHNIITQDNRCTRTPIVFVIEAKCEEMRPEGYAAKNKIINQEGIEIEIKEIVEAIRQNLETAVEKCMTALEAEDSEMMLSVAKDLDDIHNIIDVDAFIEEYCNHWRLVHYDEMFRPKTSEGGFFLTEKAANAHLKINGHHYREPRTYVEYAHRNPEVEGIVNFLKKVAQDSVHDQLTDHSIRKFDSFIDEKELIKAVNDEKK
jgi:hypothetical protein